MSDHLKDGGAAFPLMGDKIGNTQFVWEGMSLRDYLASNATDGDVKDFQGKLKTWSRTAARYGFADEMLREREKGKEN